MASATTTNSTATTAPTTSKPFASQDITFDYGDWENIVDCYKDWGVVIVRGVLNVAEVNAQREQLRSEIELACPGVDFEDDNAKTGWPLEHLPTQTRRGLFQSLLGNLPSVWAARSHPNVVTTFRSVISHIRNKPASSVGTLVTSVDGINVKPPVAPFSSPISATQAQWAADFPGTVNPREDWPHLDQTSGPWTKYVQGQLVLEDSTASFVCSPGSHKVFNDIVDLKAPSKSTGAQWCKLNAGDMVRRAGELIKGAGGHLQVPIRAPPGSLILWTSHLLHSAKHHDKPPTTAPAPAVATGTGGAGGGAGASACATPTAAAAGKDNWRTVIYISLRPLAEIGPVTKQRAHVKRLLKCLAENRMTNHGGDRLFAKAAGGRFAMSRKMSKLMKRYAADPAALWDDHAQLRPTITKATAAIVGLRAFPDLAAEFPALKPPRGLAAISWTHEAGAKAAATPDSTSTRKLKRQKRG